MILLRYFGNNYFMMRCIITEPISHEVIERETERLDSIDRNLEMEGNLVKSG